MNDSSITLPRMAVRTHGAGPALVLFHGGMGSWNHWVRNLDALAARFTVHAVDLPGYGDSAPADKSMPQDAYVERVIEALLPITGSQRFGLAGFSFGAVVAAMTAARLGDQVNAVSLMGAGGFGPTAQLDMRAIPPAAAGEAARREVFRHNLNELMIADPAAISDATIDLHAVNFDRTRYDGRAYSTSNNVAEALGQIACPMQLIYGGKDALMHPDLARRAQLVRSVKPDAQFVVLPGVGHWVQYEAAEAVNRLLLDFFAGR